MAGVREPRVLGPTAPLTDKRASAQRTVNMYLSPTESVGEDKQFILRSCPGGTSAVNCTGELRGMAATVDGLALIYVDGSSVIETNTSSSTTYTGSLSTSTGTVRMAVGTLNKIVLVDGTAGYVLDTSANTVTTIADADFPDGTNRIAFLDGYWIAGTSADQFAISALDDPTTWDALDFSSADRLPDDLTAIAVSKQELYLFGQVSTEIWYNSGGADFPFSRYTQAPIDIGIAAPYAYTNTTNSLAFVGRAGGGVPMVYMMDGHNPRRISTRFVEEALYVLDPGPGFTSDIAGLRMWSYQAPGAEFIGIDLPSPSGSGLSSTLVYEISTGQWHERRAYASGTTLGPLQSIDVQILQGRPHMGLRFHDGSGYDWRIFELEEDTEQWGGRGFYRERTWPHLIAPSHEALRYASLELLCTTGGGSASVSLEVSNDGGETFGTAQAVTISASDTTQRVRWRFLGQARDRVFRVSCASNAPFNIYGAQVETA